MHHLHNNDRGQLVFRTKSWEIANLANQEDDGFYNFSSEQLSTGNILVLAYEFDNPRKINLRKYGFNSLEYETIFVHEIDFKDAGESENSDKGECSEGSAQGEHQGEG